jgi:hypothetical protein
MEKEGQRSTTVIQSAEEGVEEEKAQGRGFGGQMFYDLGTHQSRSFM